MKIAKYWQKENERFVRCLLCPNTCIIGLNQVGICRARKNIDGELYSINYGLTVTISIDPIEKKPLYHFFPGSSILSLGANHCNFDCVFCQNSRISQETCQTFEIDSQKILAMCKKYSLNSVAFTYTEPIIWYEFVLDTAILLRQNDIKVVLVTNGYILQEPLLELLPYISAMNIDLKSINHDFYIRNCHGMLDPVLQTIETSFKHTHVEITNLLITKENDTIQEITTLVDYVASINPTIPLHFSKYFPSYKLFNDPTPDIILHKAYCIAKAKLHHCYLGNTQTSTKSDTYCAECMNRLIQRNGYNIINNNLFHNQCPKCGTTIYGIFD